MPTQEEIDEALYLEQQEAEQAQARAEAAAQEVLDDAAKAVWAKYVGLRGRRGAKEQQWLVAERLRLASMADTNGFSTNPDAPFEGQGKRRRPERNIVTTKVEIVKSQLYSMQFAGGEKNYDFLPPDNIEELAQMGITNVAERCELMENTVVDQLESSYFEREALAAMDEWTYLGTGIMKGPVNTGKLDYTYVPAQAADGKTMWVRQAKPSTKPSVRHVPVWYCYPDDSTNDFNKAEFVIEVHPLSGFELAEYKQNPGFIAREIDEAMKLGPNKLPSDNYADASWASDSNPGVFKDKFTVLEYHGPMTKDQLSKLGLEPSYEMPQDKYYGEIWVVNGRTIRFELSNIEKCTRPPYSAVVWIRDPASPFGFGIPLSLKDSQRIVNTAWQMALDNASASSAPQVVINEDAITPTDGEMTIEPGKVWLHNEPMGKVTDAFAYFITPNVLQNVLPIMQSAELFAQEESGVALWAAGIGSPQEGPDSATGMSIMKRTSTVLVELKSNLWDEHILEPRLEGMYDWNMQYNPNDAIKCPMNLRIRSATDYRTKQEYIRDMEKLSVEANQNEALGEWINFDELTKGRLNMMHIPSRGIVKTVEQVNAERQKKAEQPPEPSPEMVKLQIEQGRMELEKERLAIEREKLQFELQQGQRREEMEYEERTLNTFARITESETELARSQNEKEIAILQLAAKSENEQYRTQVQAEIGIMSEETKRILGGLNHTAKIREQLLYNKEMEIKKKTGSGI
jgi:hypothetical protein